MLVTACGGGGASSPAVSGTSGFAVDGYLSAATVVCDSNGDGTASFGETSVTTDSSGFFKFSPSCAAGIVVIGGTSVDTGLQFAGKLKAPAGSTVVTPLTTLLAEGMTVDQLNPALGLPAGTDLKNVDPARTDGGGTLINGDLMKKTQALQQLIQKMTEVFVGLAGPVGDGMRLAIYSEVAAAIATSLNTGVILMTGTTLDQTVLAGLVKATALRVGSSTILSSEVKAGANSVNADSLAQVVSGGLKTQAEAIMNATDSRRACARCAGPRGRDRSPGHDRSRTARR